MPEARNTALMATVHRDAVWGIPIDSDSLPRLATDEWLVDIGSGHADSRTLQAMQAVNSGVDARTVRLEYFGANLAINTNRGRVVADALCLPLGNRAVGAIVTSELTPDNPLFTDSEPNRRRLGTEISRVLRRGGWWIAYNEDLRDHDLPPGMIWKAGVSSPVRMASYGNSHRLPFGVYQKRADIMQPGWAQKDLTMQDGRTCSMYTQYLDQQYPPDEVFGRALRRQVATGNTDNLPNVYSSYVAPAETARVLATAVRTGKWTGTVLEIAHTSPGQYLQDLAGAHGSEIARQNGDQLLYDALFAGRLGLFVITRYDDTYIVATPSQRFCDQLTVKCDQRR